MPNEYIRAADLSTAQLEELEAHGTVEVDGATYRAWRSDATGPWLQAQAPADREFPVIYGTPAPVAFDLLGEDAEDDDDAE